MALLHLHLPIQPQTLSSSSSSSSSHPSFFFTRSRSKSHHYSSLSTTTTTLSITPRIHLTSRRRKFRGGGGGFVSKEDTEFIVSTTQDEEPQQSINSDDPEYQEDLRCVQEIQRVLKLLKKNRDMLFNEVKLTVMIEDPREIERRRLLGIDDPEAATRDDLVATLEDVNEGRVPENRIALRMLTEEMINWPNLEVEVTKKKPSKSKYAKATDTGVKPQVAAQRLNVDWDTAAEIEDTEENDDRDVPSVVGYGALYLVTALPVIIGVSVVLILFYNSLQPKKRFGLSSTIRDDIGKQESETFNSKKSLLYMNEMEKQIPVDPESLKQAPKLAEVDQQSLASPCTSACNTYSRRICPPLPLPPVVKSRFVSSSLPNSASSSPRSGSTLMKSLKKWRNQNQTSNAISSLARQHSAMVSPFASQENHLRRSKSCGERQASVAVDEFDLWSSKVSVCRRENEDNNESCYKYEGYQVDSKSMKGLEANDDEFNKCGALCLFIPGFGKGKPVRPRKEEEEEVDGMTNVVSRTVSLEKFECGSWASSAIVNDEEDIEESMRLYFDLPLELIQNNLNDAHSPIATAFVFDKDPKGVLKKSTSKGSTAKPQEPSRRVQFSPSFCISPRLRKAREDFNAYLEAQDDGKTTTVGARKSCTCCIS